MALGYATYVFASTSAQVASHPFVLPVAAQFPAIRERHIGVDQLMVLAALLTGRNLAALARERNSITVFGHTAARWFPTVRDLGAEWGCQSGECPVVLHVPDGFTSQLARLTGEQITHYARAWAAAPWWGSNGTLAHRQAGRVVLYLHDLSQLAARARAESKALYLWVGDR